MQILVSTKAFLKILLRIHEYDDFYVVYAFYILRL